MFLLLLLQTNETQRGETYGNWPLIAVALLVALVVLWWLLRQRRPGLPTFPIPRPTNTFIPAPRKEVLIKTTPGKPGLDVGDVTITPGEQVAWTGGPRDAANQGLRVEIRFSPNRTPFTSDKFITAGGGTVLSGTPKADFVGQSFAYLVLVTTADGDLITDSANVSVARAGTRAN